LIDRAWFSSPEAFSGKAPNLFARVPVTGIALSAPYTISPERQQWFSNTFLATFFREAGIPVPPTHGPHGDEFPDPDEFRELVNTEPFIGLESFDLETIYADRRHLDILARSAAAPHLRELHLSGRGCLVGAVWGALVAGPGLSGLRTLGLTEARLHIDGLGELVNSPHLAGLERLSLETGWGRVPHPLGAEGVELLCASRHLSGLRELSLRGHRGGAAGLHALAAWPGLARLTRLDVSDFYDENPDEPDDMAPAWAALVRSPHWGQLRELNLDGGDLGSLEAILDSPNLATLRVLTFDQRFTRYDEDREVSLQDEAAAFLARCPHLVDSLELHFPVKGLSRAGRKSLRDRFGDGLVLYPDDRGAHRQPGDWATDQRYRSYFGSA
jgi:hypothetical protein